MRILVLAAIWMAGAAVAQEVPLPEGASPTTQTDEPALRVATGPFASGLMPVIEARGAADHRAWRIPGTDETPRQMLDAAREALIADGYTVLFECSAEDCGGFDFRYSLPVIAEPGMHVDLGRYRYLSARRGDDLIALWASRAPQYGFIQVSTGKGPAGEARQVPLRIPSAPDPATPRPAGKPTPPAEPLTEAPAQAAPPSPQSPPEPTAEALFASGHLVLEGVDFAPGSSELINPDAPVLSRLAEWLQADPERALVLVGHTDATGGLSGNIAISRARAKAVRKSLIADHGIAPARISAEGAGWMAPRAPNDTDEGRALNRRVEAIPR